MGGHLSHAQAVARQHCWAALAPLVDAQRPVLVALSGGADSLALASTVAFLARREGFAAGAVIVDHQLQPQSQEVAAQAAAAATTLGLDPVVTVAVDCHDDGAGTEAAARQARYQALTEQAQHHRAPAVLLAHTADDQAEQVLLGLIRGSGTRSLAGMPPRRGIFLRPFLGLTRQQTEAICRREQLAFWQDPMNTDPQFLRVRVREEILPFLTQRCGRQLRENLVRTAEICYEDAEYLSAQAQTLYQRLAEPVPPGIEPPDAVHCELSGLRAAPAPLRKRVYRLVMASLAAPALTAERVGAIEQLVQGSTSAGPVQLAGGVEVWRGQKPAREQNPAEYGKLVFRRVQP